MNGAESLIRTLSAGGIATCFTNPGTSEMHLVAALDHVQEMRCILGLFEGVVTGGADGYARMAGKPACTLLHLGPGLANGLANLHNAFRAHVPIVNIVGQHSTQHLQYDAPLTSDIEALARPYSAWLQTSDSAYTIGSDGAEAVAAARRAPGQIATLIVPADVAWSEGGTVAKGFSVAQAPEFSTTVIERAAVMLRSSKRTAMLLAGSALYGKGIDIAGRVAGATSAKLLAPYPFTRLQRGAGIAPVERIPYIFEQATELLREFRQIILVGARAPVSYFASPGRKSTPTPEDCEIHAMAREDDDCVTALTALAEALSLDQSRPIAEKAWRPAVPCGEITPFGVASAVGALLPENAIVVDESMTSGRGLMKATRGSPPHDWLANTGGSIGIAMPLAVGAAVACPERRVLCLSADGSGMYTAQALWTMARESLKITTVIFANRAYAVLKREYSALGVGDPGPRAAALFDIGHPDIDWVALANSMGVPATRAASLEDFGKALRAGFESEGPELIEVNL
jgi:acetolactate synthase-1/2/3 large subunit